MLLPLVQLTLFFNAAVLDISVLEHPVSGVADNLKGCLSGCASHKSSLGSSRSVVTDLQCT